MSTPPRSWMHPDTHYLTALRDPWYQDVARLQSTFSALTSSFWTGRGVINMHLPLTTGSISSPMGIGSDSTPVSVEIEGVKTYLADSMQFMLEFGARLNLEGAFYVMPSFRGEAADSTHLCQFYHSEAELPGDLSTVMSVVEEYVRYLVAGFLRQEEEIIKKVAGDVEHLHALLDRKRGFTRVTFDEAAALLSHRPEYVREHANLGSRARSLTRAGERVLMAELGEFTWVTEMDHLSVPFYQAFTDASRARSANADLLFGIGEIVGAGQRHETAAQVVEALELHGVPPESYEWYTKMRVERPLTTSGFGMGVERFLMWLVQHDDIRDFSILLRFNGRDVLP